MQNCYRLSIQSHLTRLKEDNQMNSGVCREGPIQNAYVQGPEYCTTPLLGQSTICECVRLWKCCIFICNASFWSVLPLHCPCCTLYLFILLFTLLLLTIPIVPTCFWWWMSSFAANLFPVKPGHCCCLCATSLDTGNRDLSIWILYVHTWANSKSAFSNTWV